MSTHRSSNSVTIFAMSLISVPTLVLPLSISQAVFRVPFFTALSRRPIIWIYCEATCKVSFNPLVLPCASAHCGIRAALFLFRIMRRRDDVRQFGSSTRRLGRAHKFLARP